jgi:hypothetical protein
LRISNFTQRFYFGHDADLAFWTVKDIVINHHLRLIGQETSSQGLFIGPLFYYSLIPFYYLTNFDPIGTLGYSWIIGLFSILSLFIVSSKIHGKKVGIIATLLYSASFGISLTDREVFPTTPIYLWTIWFYYAINQLSIGKKSSLYILAILFSLVWHIQLGLVILALPTILIGLKKLRHFPIKDIFLSMLLFVILLTPFLLFEYRHNYQQIRSQFLSLEKHSQVQRTLSEKIIQVFTYSFKNVNFALWDRPQSIPVYLIPALLTLSFLYLIYIKKIRRDKALIYILWYFTFIAFFTIHPINLSEYYLNGLTIIWIMIAAQILSIFSTLTVIIIILFIIHNFSLHRNYHGNFNGYVERKAIVNFIANDARQKNYPCVSISYMTAPGYDLGYRYFYWAEKLKIVPVHTNAPVYTIVFPQNRANRLDKNFGALGLILPEYDKYTVESIAKSCQGRNENEEGDMFGFTK